MKRQAKDTLKRLMFRVHRLGTRFGVDILPVHYYSCVPDIRELLATMDLWAKPSSLPGVHVDLDEQVATMRRMCNPYQQEYAGNRVHHESIAKGYGPGFGYIEAQALHGVLRSLTPARIIEVGSGCSTYSMLTASQMNQAEGGRASAITCVEPFPSQWLRDSKDIRLIQKKAQACPLEVFEELGEGDFLFIDSSHAVKPGSDVNYLYLEVLPRLRPGVTVHIHDIWLPYDYQPHLLHSMLYWMENSLLRAYLIHNPKIEILFCMSHLHYDRPAAIKEVFPEYNPRVHDRGLLPSSIKPYTNPIEHFPSSIYLRTRWLNLPISGGANRSIGLGLSSGGPSDAQRNDQEEVHP